MEIVYLADYLTFIPQLAQWHHNQWGHLNPTTTLADRESSLHHKAAYRSIPTTFIALDENKQILYGSASIVVNDLSTHPELTPWLASVYVDHAFRNRGVGSALVKRVMDEAVALKTCPLYLITPDQQKFYTRLGWQEVKEVDYRNERVTIMEWSL